jgi:hypothetical protein
MNEYYCIGLNFVDKKVYFQKIDPYYGVESCLKGISYDNLPSKDDVFVENFTKFNNELFYTKEYIKDGIEKVKLMDERFVDLIFHKSMEKIDVIKSIDEVVLLKEII